ncbi:hypothetical protein KUCAC02_032940, partial [Chaenocephalus aceratus]
LIENNGLFAASAQFIANNTSVAAHVLGTQRTPRWRSGNNTRKGESAARWKSSAEEKR